MFQYPLKKNESENFQIQQQNNREMQHNKSQKLGIQEQIVIFNSEEIDLLSIYKNYDQNIEISPENFQKLKSYAHQKIKDQLMTKLQLNLVECDSVHYEYSCEKNSYFLDSLPYEQFQFEEIEINSKFPYLKKDNLDLQSMEFEIEQEQFQQVLIKNLFQVFNILVKKQLFGTQNLEIKIMNEKKVQNVFKIKQAEEIGEDNIYQIKFYESIDYNFLDVVMYVLNYFIKELNEEGIMLEIEFSNFIFDLKCLQEFDGFHRKMQKIGVNIQSLFYNTPQLIVDDGVNSMVELFKLHNKMGYLKKIVFDTFLTTPLLNLKKQYKIIESARIVKVMINYNEQQQQIKAKKVSDFENYDYNNLFNEDQNDNHEISIEFQNCSPIFVMFLKYYHNILLENCFYPVVQLKFDNVSMFNRDGQRQIENIESYLKQQLDNRERIYLQQIALYKEYYQKQKLYRQEVLWDTVDECNKI